MANFLDKFGRALTIGTRVLLPAVVTGLHEDTGNHISVSMQPTIPIRGNEPAPRDIALNSAIAIAEDLAHAAIDAHQAGAAAPAPAPPAVGVEALRALLDQVATSHTESSDGSAAYGELRDGIVALLPKVEEAADTLEQQTTSDAVH